MNDPIQILLVGHDRSSLTPFEMALGSAETYQFSVASDLEGALLSIAQRIPNLIITSWDLNGRTALDLMDVLKTQKEWEPVQVLVYGEGVKHSDILAAKSRGALDVMPLPVNRRVLQQHLANITERVRVMTEGPKVETAPEIRHRLLQVEMIAPLPALVKEILEVHENPEATAKAMAEVIKKDQSLTSRVLRIVNSAYYGFHRKIGNTRDAVVLLGFEEIKNITLAACLMDTFPLEGAGRFQPKEFWLHSIASAYVARALASRVKELSAENAFVMGLLHDIGKAVLFQHFPETYTTVLEASAEKNLPLFEVEQQMMKIDHAEVGGIVAESWDLPTPLVRAIQLHHTPDDAEEGYESFVTNVANYFAHKQQVGASGTPTFNPPSSFAGPALGHEGPIDDLFSELEVDITGLRHLLPHL
jgi:putative nucleotidyltransferase with HDIG domain